MAGRLFRDRREAGRILAGMLERYRGRDDVVVLALPRGGVPVAYEVAAALDAPLDIFLVRKLGVPGREEVAMGAIATGGTVVLNEDVIRGIGVTPEMLTRVVEAEARELLRRERAYREGREPIDITGRASTSASPGRKIANQRTSTSSSDLVTAQDGVPDESLSEMVGDAHFVLLGEASHGTHEFYSERARLTQRPVEERGIGAVAVEGDWPDAYRVNRFVRGRSEDDTAEEALRGFQRFPTWMWRNSEVLDFVGWLRGHNDRQSDENDKVGFYGLDLYSLRRSMDEVVAYLERVDPAAASGVREPCSCYDH